MQSKKFNLLLVFVLLIMSGSFAQSTSGYSVFDSSVITKKGQPQQNEFLNHSYNFPAKPRNMWEVGVAAGMFSVNGDVPQVLPTFGFSAHVRKSLGYLFSLRLEYMYGIAKGLDWNASKGYKNNSAWNDIKGYKNDTTFVFYNYKTQVQDLSIQGLFSLNNIRFHKNKSKVSSYIGAGIGLSTYRTMINAKNESNGTDYANLFNEVQRSEDYKYGNRDNILSRLKDGMDDTYETEAENDRVTRAAIGDATLNVALNVLIGIEYKLSKRINIALEDRHTFIHDDLLDGQRWQEHPSASPALTGNWDTYNYLSLGLNFNLGKKSVEPLWWINPLDYVYGEINNPKHMNLPKPKYEDADSDGVLDQLDREPNTPAGAKVDTHGVAIDTDGDGVPDYKDKQLITPTECQPVDADGVGKCPDPECCKNAAKIVEATVQCPSDYPSLSFKGNSSDLSKDAKTMLSAVAAKMKANPKCNIVVNGYPEASKASQAVCQQRTDAVSKYLIQKEGISADRITTNCTIGGGDKNTIDIKSN